MRKLLSLLPSKSLKSRYINTFTHLHLVYELPNFTMYNIPSSHAPSVCTRGGINMATFKQYEKRDGTKLWLFEAYLGINKATGKPDKVRRRNFKTKKEAQLSLSRLQVEY